MPKEILIFSSDVIRSLSWNQPYASLMLHDKIETRKKPTKVRGKVLICSCKKAYDENVVLQISGTIQQGRLDKILCIDKSKPFGRMPCGVAIAIADLVDCRPMRKQDEDKCFVAYQEPWIEWRETLEGICDKRESILHQLYCWIFENVQAIEPFPFKGKQGWGILDEETKGRIKILSKPNSEPPPNGAIATEAK